MKSKFLIAYLLLLVTSFAFGQSSFDGFNYQGVLRDALGNPIVNQSELFKVEIREGGQAGQLDYDETFNATTNTYGYFNFVIGKGTTLNNGAFPSFNSMVWKDTLYQCNIYLFNTSSSLYVLLTSKAIQAVPFALYSKSTAQKHNLSTLADVDTAGINTGAVLKWNGIKWVIGQDNVVSDTVFFAQTTNNATYSDTSNYAINAQNIIPSDTANYAFQAGNANFANQATNSIYSDTASYALNANIANFALGNWNTTGNAGINLATDFLGTTDAKDVNIKTNDTVRAVIKSSGRIGIGTALPNTDFHIQGNNGLLFEGTYGVGTIPLTGAGTRLMWYPRKAAFRAGTLDPTGGYNTFWDDLRIGNYSMAVGKNVKAEGQFSVSMGEGCQAYADYSTALGYGSVVWATAKYGFAAGHNTSVAGDAGVALGRGGIVRGISGTSIGYHCEANGDYSSAFGFYTVADGLHSTSMGYYCKASHTGSFVYSDYSVGNSTYTLFSTAANQFTVRASGGYILYTNPTLTTGVSLAAGSGSWSTLSDSTKKENFQQLDYDKILKNLDEVDVYTWNYKTQDKSIRHMGPTAQQFYKTFGLGESGSMISSVDIDGVNMAALKALSEKTKLLEKSAKDLEAAAAEIKVLREERQLFKERLAQIEKLLIELELKNKPVTNNSK